MLLNLPQRQVPQPLRPERLERRQPSLLLGKRVPSGRQNSRQEGLIPSVATRATR